MSKARHCGPYIIYLFPLKPCQTDDMGRRDTPACHHKSPLLAQLHVIRTVELVGFVDVVGPGVGILMHSRLTICQLYPSGTCTVPSVCAAIGVKPRRDAITAWAGDPGNKPFAAAPDSIVARPLKIHVETRQPLRQYRNRLFQLLGVAVI